MTDARGLPARAAALAILTEVLHRRRPFDLALNAARNLEKRDAGFAHAIASETLRRMGQLDALVRSFVTKLPPPHRAGPTFEILLASACELLFLKVSPHAVVDAANRLAQSDPKAVHFKPLINAVLRRIAREGEEAVARQDAERLNTPDWLWSRWQQAYGEDTTRAIAHAHLSQAPIDIVLKDPEGAGEFPRSETLFDGVHRLETPAQVDELPGFHGQWWVQDAAATLPACLLGDVRGKTVLDLCAAPGGKTLQLAARGAQVIAVERNAERFTRVQSNLQRMGLEARLVHEDVRDFRPETLAPCVLLDAPCTATGTIRRHPELPWIKGAADVTQCASAAAELLDAAAAMTAPGGLLVFAVCSLEPEEGIEQIESYLAGHPDFERIALSADELYGHGEWISPTGDLRTLPCHMADRGGMDGFYAARLRRKS